MRVRKSKTIEPNNNKTVTIRMAENDRHFLCGIQFDKLFLELKIFLNSVRVSWHFYVFTV